MKKGNRAGRRTDRSGRDPKLNPIQTPSTHDIAWAAGIYEGEGSCTRVDNGNRFYVRAYVSQKDKWILKRLKCLFGGSITSWKQKNSTGTFSRWYVCGDRSREFILAIFPLLSPRRQSQIQKSYR